MVAALFIIPISTQVKANYADPKAAEAIGNPAEIDFVPYLEFSQKNMRVIPRQGTFCGHSLDFNKLSRSPSVDKVSESCVIRFDEDAMVINNTHSIKRSSIVHYWLSEVDGRNHQLLAYLFVRHMVDDELKTSVFVGANHKTWQAIFWNQFNIWFSGN